MTTKEMMEVMQHYVDGGEVEQVRRRYVNQKWATIRAPNWDWDTYEYRIKPEPKKTKTVWFWKVKTKNGGWLFMGHNMHTEEEARNLWPDALEYKRMDILGSEEVEV